MLPTTPPNLTAQGTILGTFQYMAPEQLEGQEADARTDIFAFGAVLYEMLTGKKAFDGKSQASLIAAIMHAAPAPLSMQHPLIPPLLDHIVTQCLAKERDGRWQSAADVMRELKWIEGDASRASARVALVAPPKRLLASVRLAWIAAAVALLAVVALAIPAARHLRESIPEALQTRFEIQTPPTSDSGSFALSSDGRQLAFVATAEGASRLWVRSLDQVTPRVLAGTDGAASPFWAPDGRALGFFANGKLKRIELTGGAPQVLAEAPLSRGATWNRDGVILFASTAILGLMQVPASGGMTTTVTRLAPGQIAHRWPQFLPGGRQFLFYVLGDSEMRGVYVGSLDGGEPKRVVDSEAAGLYAAPGYLLSVSQAVLVARRFDPARGSVSGEPVTVSQSVGDPAINGAGFSVADAGVLAHRGYARGQRQLLWVDRAGKTSGLLMPPDETALTSPELAANGERLAFASTVQGNTDVWLVAVARGIKTRFTFDAPVEASPVWSPDGSRIAFHSTRNGRFDLFEKPADGSTDERSLLVTTQDKAPQDWSPDGGTCSMPARIRRRSPTCGSCR